MTKVKLTYTVDLEDIPNEVSDMLLKTYWSLKNTTDKLDQPVTENNVAGVIELIDNVRQSLADIDLKLDDCYSILIGYLGAIRSNSIENTKELSEKLSELENSLGNMKQKNESD
jgi:hypothetical protein|tara:strand:+ start:16813 stop:17154 length:342 start_codon:yes stop_codon:yes gene_type:complete